MSGASMRDVSTIKVPRNLTWSETEFDTCPWCGRLTPAPFVLVHGQPMRFIPYPCDCPGSRRARGSLDDAASRARERKVQPVPQRYADVIAGLDASDYASTIEDGTGLYFHGQQGLGKTAMAYAIASNLRRKGWTVEVAKMEAIMTEIADTYSTPDTKGSVLIRLTKCGLLIIDDLGSENPTETTVATFLRIIDDRCEAEKPIVITSNYSMPELGKRLARANANTSHSIISRLRQMTTPIEVTGQDRRLA